MASEFRKLPGVDSLLTEAPLKCLGEEMPREVLVAAVRRYLEGLRQAIAGGKTCPPAPRIAAVVAAEVTALLRPGLRPVINASGVIIHTNLGRVTLSDETVAAMHQARGYSNLEFDLESGRRGSRHTHVEKLLCWLTGAEAAMVVNNNAGAVLLSLAAIARRKEVIVSRGQAVQIGGGFRIPDVMRQSGAKLVEVGTTNCTYLADYAAAITPRTAAILRVHSSNFRVTGFTRETSLTEMIEVGRAHEVPVIDDLGSGCLLDTTRFGLDAEPRFQDSVAAGAAMVCASGDKLLGGPQAGLIVGQKNYVDKLRKHPLARAVRVDKITLAGLAMTLTHYLRGEAEVKIPVWRMIAAPLDEIERRAGRWAEALGWMASIIPGETMVGGGSLPGGTLPTRLVVVRGEDQKPGLALALSRWLRRREVPVVGRINEEVLLLDPRTVLPEDDDVIIGVLGTATQTYPDFRA